MEKIILAINGILGIVLLFLLCVAAAVFIIKICKSPKTVKLNEEKNSESLYNLAFKDNLTGLLNRNAYYQKIQELEDSKQDNIWILLFDIDDFKSINDTNGHLYGDDILISAADRLRKIFITHNHSIYRIGGDEFLVISENIEEEQIIDLLLQIKEAEEHNKEFRFSKGYSKMENDAPDAFRKSFYYADQMLYADKNSKK